MKKSKYGDTQIVSILKETEAGQSVKEICQVRDQFGMLLQLKGRSSAG